MTSLDVGITCHSCGATSLDRKTNKPNDDQGITNCQFCNADKCCMCDMGDDVQCLSCEGNEDQE